MAKKRNDSGKRRPVVGIMTGSFHTENSSKIGTITSQYFQNRDVDIHLYQGLDAKRYLNAGVYLDEGFDYHYYSLFGYSVFDQPDLLILSFGTISAIVDPLPLEEFLSHLPDVPIILLEDGTPVKNGINVTIDNYKGMQNCIEHLIKDHGYQEIVFVSGPKDVPDAAVRLNAFRETMKENGLEVDENRIIYGNFTKNVDHLIEENVQLFGMPEAFACANDDMAESVYRVVRSHGLRPGVDVAVTGFDNTIGSRHMSPPLSTVFQDFYEVSNIAVRKAVSFFNNGKDFTSVNIPTQFIARPSCGCEDTDIDDEPETLDHDTWVRTQTEIDELKVDNIMSSLIIRNLFVEDISTEGFFSNLGYQIALMNTKRSFICLLDEPVKLTDKDKMFVPDHLRMMLYQDGVTITSYNETNAPRIDVGGLTSFTSGESESLMATFLLFYGEYHYGIFCVELTPSQMLFYYTLSLEIGSGLRYLYLALAQKHTLHMLNEKNQILDYTASHDTLTGHLNRAGVMAEAFSYIHKFKRGTRIIAVMGDLDHLKQINDTFGHNAGDDAICTAAQALAENLPEGCPLGRTGGDEYTCFFHPEGDTEKAIEKFKKGVLEYCENINNTADKPYYIGVSIGCHVFNASDEVDLTSALKAADEQLYEAKKTRRESVIK